MTRSDWLILFVAAKPGRPVDPVRLQKGLFLLAMSGALDDGERYAFEPYAYGPMSRQLYRDARALVERGLLERREVAGQDWKALEIAPAGVAHAQRLRERAKTTALDAVIAIRAELDALSFSALLERVYSSYPDYAVRSVFRRS